MAKLVKVPAFTFVLWEFPLKSVRLLDKIANIAYCDKRRVKRQKHKAFIGKLRSQK